MHVSRSRARTARFVAALTLALVLAGMLVFTTFSAASPERFPKQLASGADPHQTYRVGGRVVADSADRSDGTLRFKLAHPGTAAGPQIDVVYDGTVPDTFREGRDIIIDVKQNADGTYTGQGNSLLTKCPSKFNGEDMNPDTGPADRPLEPATGV